MKDILIMNSLLLGVCGSAFLLVIAAQIGLKKVHGAMSVKSKERFIFIKNVYEADSWQLFGVCILIGLLVWWLI